MAGLKMRSTFEHGPSHGWIFLPAATSVLIILWLIIVINQSREFTIRVGSGVPGGSLAEITPAVVEVLDAELEGVRFEIVDSLGTRENVEMLKNGRIDIAIIYEGIKPRTTPNSSLRTIARLYVNPLHVIASRASGIRKFEDIDKKHIIGIPPNRVASYKRALDVLDHYGISIPKGYKILEFDNFYVGADELKTGNMDIAFFGGAIPIPSVEKYFVGDASQFRFVPISASKAISMRYPAYRVFTIPAMSYLGSPPFPRGEIVTIASVASLVGRSDLEEKLGKSKFYRMTKALFDSRSYLVNQYPYLNKMSDKFSSEETEHPLFNGSAGYYARNRPIVWDLVTLWVSSIFSLLFLFITLISYASARRKISSKRPQ